MILFLLVFGPTSESDMISNVKEIMRIVCDEGWLNCNTTQNNAEQEIRELGRRISTNGCVCIQGGLNWGVSHDKHKRKGSSYFIPHIISSCGRIMRQKNVSFIMIAVHCHIIPHLLWFFELLVD